MSWHLLNASLHGLLSPSLYTDDVFTIRGTDISAEQIVAECVQLKVIDALRSGTFARGLKVVEDTEHAVFIDSFYLTSCGVSSEVRLDSESMWLNVFHLEPLGELEPCARGRLDASLVVVSVDELLDSDSEVSGVYQCG